MQRDQLLHRDIFEAERTVLLPSYLDQVSEYVRDHTAVIVARTPNPPPPPPPPTPTTTPSLDPVQTPVPPSPLPLVPPVVVLKA